MFFREVYPPAWILQMHNQFEWMLLNVAWWLDGHTLRRHPSFFFCFKPGTVSDKNTRRNIFTIIFLFSFHKDITSKGESSCCLPKVLVLGQKLILGKPSNYAKLVRWFPLQHQPLCAYLKIHATRFAIFMINICIYNHLLKKFVNRKHKGV